MSHSALLLSTLSCCCSTYRWGQGSEALRGRRPCAARTRGGENMLPVNTTCCAGGAELGRQEWGQGHFTYVLECWVLGRTESSGESAGRVQAAFDNWLRDRHRNEIMLVNLSSINYHRSRPQHVHYSRGMGDPAGRGGGDNGSSYRHSGPFLLLEGYKQLLQSWMALTCTLMLSLCSTRSSGMS